MKGSLSAVIASMRMKFWMPIYLDKKILNITWPNDKIIKKILKENAMIILQKIICSKNKFYKRILILNLKKHEMNYLKKKL